MQGPDGKRLLHPVPRFPADIPARIEIDTDGQIQPARAGPDIPDIRHPISDPVAHRESPDCATLAATFPMGTVSVVRLQRVFWRALRPFARITRTVRCRHRNTHFGSCRDACAGCHTHVWRDSTNALRMCARIIMSSSWRRLGARCFHAWQPTTDADTRASTQAC